MTADQPQSCTSFDEPLRESIRELRRGYQSISDCLEQTTAQCELRTAELVECRQQLAEAQQALCEQQDQIARRERDDAARSQRFVELEGQLDAARRALEEAVAKALQAEQDATHARELWQTEHSHNDQLQAEIERLHDGGLSARDDLARLESQLARLAGATQDAAELRDKLEAAEAQLAELRAARSDNRDSDELREQLRVATSERALVDRELAQLREQMTSLSASASQAAELRAELAAAQRELDLLRQSQETSSVEPELRERLAIVTARSDQLEAEVDRLNRQVQTLNTAALESAELRGALAEAQAESTRLRELAAAPTAESELRNLLAAALAERDQLDAEAKRLHEHLTAMSQAAVDAAEMRGELASARAEMARLRDQAPASAPDEELRQQLAATIEQRDQLASEVSQLCEHLTSLTETGLAAAQLRGELSAAQAEISRLRELEAMPSAEGELQHRLAAAVAERDRLDAELARMHQQVATLTEAAVDAAQVRGKLAAAEAEVARLRAAKAPSSDDGQLRAQLAAAMAERDQFEREMSQLHDHLASMADSAAMVSQLRGELAEVRAELARAAQLKADASQAVHEQLAAALAHNQTVEQELSRIQQRMTSIAEESVASVRQSEDLAAVRAELVRLREIAPVTTSDGPLREQLAAEKVRREQLEAELAKLEQQASSASEAAVVAGQLRGELAATQAELTRLREQAQQPTAEATLREELSAANLAREQLEVELDSIRQRAAELNEALDEQQRLVTDERQQWTEELRRLRRAVERQSETATRRSRRSASATPDADERCVAGGVGLASTERRADPVIDTVREQFEALQKRKAAGARVRTQ